MHKVWVSVEGRVDLSGFHDVLTDLFGSDFHADTPEKLLVYFNMLPNTIRAEAIINGCDTVFKDNAYEYFEKLKEKDKK